MRTWSLLILTLACCLPGRAAAERKYDDYSRYLHWEDAFLTEGDDVPAAVDCVIGGVPYWATVGTNSGLTFFSLGPDGPAPVGNLPLAGVEQDLVVGDIYSYVASQPDRLAKILTIDPTQPTLLRTDFLPAAPVDMVAYGEYLLIACGTDGLLVFDPTEYLGHATGVIGTWPGPANEVQVDGDVVLVRGDGAVVSVSLADPTAPATLDSLVVASGGRLLAEPGRAWVSNARTVTEIDTSDPYALAAGRTFTAKLNYGAIAAMTLYDGGLMAALSGRLQWFDLASGQVAWTGQGAVGSTTRGEFVLADGHLGLATGPGGFHVFAAQPIGWPSAPTPYDPNVSLEQLQVEGDFLFGAYGRTVYCYDLSLSAPYQIWTFQSDLPYEYVKDLKVVGDRVYVGYGNGKVSILQYAGSGYTRLAGFWSAGVEVVGLVPLAGDPAATLAVFVDPIDDPYLEGSLLLYDITDPANPVLRSTTDGLGYIGSIDAVGSTVVLSDNSSGAKGIVLYDASDPAAPVPAATIPTPVFSEVTLNGPYAYAVEPPTMQAFDLSDPYAPVAGPPVLVPAGWYLEATGNAGYMLTTGLVYDLSDPLHPVPIGAATNQWDETVSQCAAADGYLVMYNYYGLNVLPSHRSGASGVADDLPDAPGLALRAYPNPFNPRLYLSFATAASGPAEIGIYDLRGRRVDHWTVPAAPDGTVRAMWNGRDARGRDASSGVYLVRVRSGSVEGATKVLLAR